MNLHFVSADEVVVKDETWCQTLGHLNPKSCDINKMKFDSDVSDKVKFKWSGHKNQGN